MDDYEDWISPSSVGKWNKTYADEDATIQAVLPPSCCKRTNIGKKKNDFTQLSSDDFVSITQCMEDAKNGTYNTDVRVFMICYY